MSANVVPIKKRPDAPRKLVVHYGGFSTEGIKIENQDAFSAFSPSNYTIDEKGFAAAIADGLSTASHAREAAQLVVTQFLTDYFSTPPTWSTQKSAFKVVSSLNDWLYAQSDDVKHNNQQWLTTFSSLIIKSSTGYLFHVGDSRIAQVRDGNFEYLTKDHSRKHGKQHMVLTRALGGEPRVKIDAFELAVQQGDFYILSSDGFHDFVDKEYVANTLANLSGDIDSDLLETTGRELAQKAMENGSDDNVSCLIAYVESLPVKEMVELERELLSKRILPALGPGLKLDGYEVIKTLHESTRSHLYLVKRPDEPEPRVLKVPSQNFTDDVHYIQGFIREAWLGERVNHRNIMKVTQARNSEYLYHYCEYIDGQTLSDWMHDNPKPSIAVVRDIVKQVIAALRTFQRMEVLHRDLKPDNIMIDKFGKITLIDYGTAAVAALDEDANTIQNEVPQGTVNYIAPETLLNMHADYYSDLFSLGVITYELLTGELPFKPMTRQDALKAEQQNWQYRSIKQFRSDLPVWMDYALQKATEPVSSKRYQAYSEFEADICKPNMSAVKEYQSQPLLQRDPVLFWKGLSVLLIILLIASLST
ncbi:protein kinase [Thalassotalea euphylliae]|uniref:protein kinase domain-containing protein n=1 Tax=Thalassotalea euphylliae TaxID=1655234 RepID=UPI003634D96F